MSNQRADGKRAMQKASGYVFVMALCVVLGGGCGVGRSKSEVLRDRLISLMDRYGDVMESITDARTAEAAKPTIKKIIEENNALMPQIKKIIEDIHNNVENMPKDELEKKWGAYMESIDLAHRTLRKRLQPVHARLQNDREVEKVFKDIDMRELFR